jgi:hypothetical protein
MDKNLRCMSDHYRNHGAMPPEDTLEDFLSSTGTQVVLIHACVVEDARLGVSAGSKTPPHSKKNLVAEFVRKISEPDYYPFKRSITKWDFTPENVKQLVAKYAPTRAIGVDAATLKNAVSPVADVDNDGTRSDDEESLDEESLEEESLEEESLEEESLEEESLEEESLDEESLDEESLDEESLDEESLDEESLDEESLDEESLDEESLLADEEIEREDDDENLAESPPRKKQRRIPGTPPSTPRKKQRRIPGTPPSTPRKTPPHSPAAMHHSPRALFGTEAGPDVAGTTVVRPSPPLTPGCSQEFSLPGSPHFTPLPPLL